MQVFAAFTELRPTPQPDITRRAAEAAFGTYLEGEVALLSDALQITGREAHDLLNKQLADNLGCVLFRLATIGQAFHGTPPTLLPSCPTSPASHERSRLAPC